MQEGKVKLADGSPESRARIHLFMQAQKLHHPERNIKTLEDAILFAIDEAVKVPALEARVKDLEEICNIFEKTRKKE